MSPTVGLGLAFALACAIVMLAGFLLKERGARSSPPVVLRSPVRSTLALFRNPWWTAGFLVAGAGWVFHVAALALAPISLVQVTIAAGLVLLTPLADRVFDHDVARREWIGVALTAVGLVLVAVTLGAGAEHAHAEYSGRTLALYVGVLAAVGVVAALVAMGRGLWAGPLLGLSCGLLWGGSDVTIKAASALLGDRGVGVVATPQVAAIAALSAVGFVVGARSLQLGPAVAVIAITTAATNIVTIASGAIVFGETMPSHPVALAGRVLGLVLVVAGAVMTPGPGAHDADDAPALSTGDQSLVPDGESS